MSKIFENFLHNVVNQVNDAPVYSLQDMFPQKEDLEVEEFEVIKGEVKTIITIYFNKKGYPVRTKTSTTNSNLKAIEELQAQIIEKMNQDKWDDIPDIILRIQELKNGK